METKQDEKFTLEKEELLKDGKAIWSTVLGKILIGSVGGMLLLLLIVFGKNYNSDNSNIIETETFTPSLSSSNIVRSTIDYKKVNKIVDNLNAGPMGETLIVKYDKTKNSIVLFPNDAEFNQEIENLIYGNFRDYEMDAWYELVDALATQSIDLAVEIPGVKLELRKPDILNSNEQLLEFDAGRLSYNFLENLI